MNGFAVSAMVETLERRLLLSATIEVEGNDAFATANVVTVPTVDILAATAGDWLTISGSIGSASDVDYFQFTLSQAAGVFFDLDAHDTGLSSLNGMLDVFTSGQTAVSGGSNDNGFDFRGFAVPDTGVGSATAAGFQDAAVYLDLAAGTYFVRVDNSTAATSSTGAYQLRLLKDTVYASSVPVLNSNPGASDTLYLDFNGHSATDDWGTYAAAAYDLDGKSTTFSPGERLAIRNVVNTTGEDYSPFNLNVTTVVPGSFAHGVAFRQVITNSSPTVVGTGSTATGVANLSSYASTTHGVNIAFTFASNFGSFGTGLNGSIMAAAVGIGNTSSHEFGHALGLSHFSQSSAPAVYPNAIMATSSSALHRELWAVGTNVNNATQDDMAIIGAASNTIGYRTDDHGNTRTAATVLTPSGNSYSGAGIIGNLTVPDRDYFKFTGSGSKQITVNVDEYVNDLDVELRLYNASGTLLATSDSSTSFDATITQTLTAGDYYVEVRSDSETGAIRESGRYTVSISTVDIVAPVLAVSSAITYTENNSATAIDAGIMVSDADSATLASGKVTITNFVAGQDVLSFTNDGLTMGNIAVTTNAGGVLTLTSAGATATTAQWQAALRGVKYANTSDNPNTTRRSVDFFVTDGTNPGNTLTSTINITAANDAPLLASIETTQLPYAPNGAAKAITATLQLTDPDTASLASATIQITGGYQNGDVLAFTNTAQIRGIFNSGDGKLTLTGADTVANYQAALRSVKYVSTNQSPAARTVSFQVSDGTGSSNIATRTIGGYAQLTGTTLNVYGTPVGDAITFTETASLTVVVNGVSTQFTPAQVTAVNIFGFAGNDTITVNSLASGTTLSADGGDDNDTLTVNGSVTVGTTLLGGNGNDTLRGGGGNDSLDGGGGNDSLDGGAGNDTYMFNTNTQLNSDSITDSAGTDLLSFVGSTTSVAVNLGLTTAQTVNANLTLTLASATSMENMTGGSGNDTLTGNTLANSLTGGGGNDALTGGAGNDTYSFDTDLVLGSDTINESGGGIDTLDFSPTTTRTVAVNLSTAAAQVVNAGLTLTLSSATTLEHVKGGAFSNVLTGNTLANTLTGGAGSDTLTGGAGNDSLDGGAGDDTYAFVTNTQLDSDTVADSAGLDRLYFVGSTNNVAVSLGLTTQQTVNANLKLTLLSATALENIYGGSGNDTLTGNTFNNSLVGGDGNDILSGGIGNDALYGQGGDDSLDGGTQDDRYLFLTTTQLGADTVADGGGTDELYFVGSTNGVAVNLGLTTQQTVAQDGIGNANLKLTLASATALENVTGGSGNDLLIGNSLNNVLLGNDGNDVLTGGAGNDALAGGNGKNIQIGGNGVDALTGGSSEDLLLGARYTGEADTASLTALLAEWISASSFDNRVAHLLGTLAGGANVGFTLTSATVKEDGVKDTLTGGSGKDWYLRNSLGAVVANRDTVNDADVSPFDSVFTEIDTWL